VFFVDADHQPPGARCFQDQRPHNQPAVDEPLGTTATGVLHAGPVGHLRSFAELIEHMVGSTDYLLDAAGASSRRRRWWRAGVVGMRSRRARVA
jgi:hypothetical protein